MTIRIGDIVEVFDESTMHRTVYCTTLSMKML